MRFGIPSGNAEPLHATIRLHDPCRVGLAGRVADAGLQVGAGLGAGLVHDIAGAAVVGEHGDGVGPLRQHERVAGREDRVLVRVGLQPARVDDRQRHAAGDGEAAQPVGHALAGGRVGLQVSRRPELGQQGLLELGLGLTGARHLPGERGGVVACAGRVAQQPVAEALAGADSGLCRRYGRSEGAFCLHTADRAQRPQHDTDLRHGHAEA